MEKTAKLGLLAGVVGALFGIVQWGSNFALKQENIALRNNVSLAEKISIEANKKALKSKKEKDELEARVQGLENQWEDFKHSPESYTGIFTAGDEILCMNNGEYSFFDLRKMEGVESFVGLSNLVANLDRTNIEFRKTVEGSIKKVIYASGDKFLKWERGKENERIKVEQNLKGYATIRMNNVPLEKGYCSPRVYIIAEKDTPEGKRDFWIGTKSLASANIHNFKQRYEAEQELLKLAAQFKMSEADAIEAYKTIDKLFPNEPESFESFKKRYGWTSQPEEE